MLIWYMETTWTFIGLSTVLVGAASYLYRSTSIKRVLKCVVSHRRDDPYFAALQQGVAEVCVVTGTTLDWVNVPEPELHALAYRDALLAEGAGHSTIICQYLPEMEGDLMDYLPHSVTAPVVVRPWITSASTSKVIAYDIGLETAAMLAKALELLPDRPAIVCLPWFVDASTLDGQVTVEKYSQKALLARSRSDTIKTIILPDDPTLDYQQIRALFTNVQVGVIGIRRSSAGDVSVWQEAKDQGTLAAFLACSLMSGSARLWQDSVVHTQVKFAVK